VSAARVRRRLMAAERYAVRERLLGVDRDFRTGAHRQLAIRSWLTGRMYWVVPVPGERSWGGVR
jgi:hypothetical protein